MSDLPITDEGRVTHHFHPTILRSYDIRGIVGQTLSTSDAFAIGLGFAHIIARDSETKEAPHIAMGRDGRLTSPELAEALARGLQAGGAKVSDIGVGPTPMLYFADRSLHCDGAIQITGSHNPKDYNGFKMVKRHASFFGDDIQALGALLEDGVRPADGGSYQACDIFADYCNRLLDGFDAPLETLVWDTGNGAAGPAVEQITSQLSGTHHTLFTAIDGHFPNHHPDPVDPHTLAFLRDKVAECGAICGLGFDGDGDRLGIIDAKGRQVPGDLLTAFLAIEYLQRCPGADILFDVKSSQAAMAIVTQAGGTPLLWKTGHSHMKSRMVEIGCELAGEMSGHIFIKDGYYGFDDALYVALRVLRAMAVTGQSITDFMDSLPPSYTSPECRVPCADELKFGVMDGVAKAVQEAYPAEAITLIDGIRITDETGWWLIRASNTEAALVVRAEGLSEEALATKTAELENILATQGITWRMPS